MPLSATVQQHAHEPAIVLGGGIQTTVAPERWCWFVRNHREGLLLECSIDMTVDLHDP